jgi:hypothetical protein
MVKIQRPAVLPHKIVLPLSMRAAFGRFPMAEARLSAAIAAGAGAEQTVVSGSPNIVI